MDTKHQRARGKQLYDANNPATEPLLGAGSSSNPLIISIPANQRFVLTHIPRFKWGEKDVRYALNLSLIHI
jgi:hypothetical protein